MSQWTDKVILFESELTDVFFLIHISVRIYKEPDVKVHFLLRKHIAKKKKSTFALYTDRRNHKVLCGFNSRNIS